MAELVLDAMIDNLRRLDRDRFLDEIARAARARGDTEAVDSAEEALPLDNEALDIAEDASDSRAKYGTRKKRRHRQRRRADAPRRSIARHARAPRDSLPSQRPCRDSSEMGDDVAPRTGAIALT
jgi:hypothetical protein